MMGKNHVIVNFAVVTASTMTIATMVNGGLSASSRLSTALLNVFFPEKISLEVSNGLIYTMPMFLFGACFMLFLGSLLPDIDNKNSMVGRVIHLPFEHRTWTHSIWFVLPLIFLSCYSIWLRFAALGYILHIMFDAVSAAGICFWYPFKKYRKYSNGAFVAPGHIIKLYRTNDGSEGRFMLLVVLCCVLLCIFARQGFVNFWQWIRY